MVLSCPPVRLETPRLILRQWERQDFSPHAAMNADRMVMAFFTATLDKRESDVMLDYLRELIIRHGWGVWAVERKADRAFLGSVGLHAVQAKLPFAPCVEIGWRLAQAYWGQGYATEAARESLRYGFDVLDLPEIVSFTSLLNERSQAVMRRLGMVTDPARDFEHPDVPKGSALRKHCLYRMTRGEWEDLKAGSPVGHI